MRAQLLRVLDGLIRNFWSLPAFMMLCTVGLYWLAITLDQMPWVQTLKSVNVVYSGGFSDARTILTVIAETMVAIASLSFATVAVVLTLATSQFGPG